MEQVGSNVPALRERLLPLARWVAKYVADYRRQPDQGDIPPDLGHLWQEFQASKSALQQHHVQRRQAVQREPPASPAHRAARDVTARALAHAHTAKSPARMRIAVGPATRGVLDDQENRVQAEQQDDRHQPFAGTFLSPARGHGLPLQLTPGKAPRSGAAGTPGGRGRQFGDQHNDLEALPPTPLSQLNKAALAGPTSHLLASPPSAQRSRSVIKATPEHDSQGPRKSLFSPLACRLNVAASPTRPGLGGGRLGVMQLSFERRLAATQQLAAKPEAAAAPGAGARTGTAAQPQPGGTTAASNGRPRPGPRAAANPFSRRIAPSSARVASPPGQAPLHQQLDALSQPQGPHKPELAGPGAGHVAEQPQAAAPSPSAAGPMSTPARLLRRSQAQLRQQPGTPISPAIMPRRSLVLQAADSSTFGALAERRVAAVTQPLDVLRQLMPDSTTHAAAAPAAQQLAHNAAGLAATAGVAASPAAARRPDAQRELLHIEEEAAVKLSTGDAAALAGPQAALLEEDVADVLLPAALRAQLRDRRRQERQAQQQRAQVEGGATEEQLPALPPALQGPHSDGGSQLQQQPSLATWQPSEGPAERWQEKQGGHANLQPEEGDDICLPRQPPRSSGERSAARRRLASGDGFSGDGHVQQEPQLGPAAAGPPAPGQHQEGVQVGGPNAAPCQEQQHAEPDAAATVGRRRKSAPAAAPTGARSKAPAACAPAGRRSGTAKPAAQRRRRSAGGSYADSDTDPEATHPLPANPSKAQPAPTTTGVQASAEAGQQRAPRPQRQAGAAARKLTAAAAKLRDNDDEWMTDGSSEWGLDDAEAGPASASGSEAVSDEERGVHKASAHAPRSCKAAAGNRPKAAPATSTGPHECPAAQTRRKRQQAPAAELASGAPPAKRQRATPAAGTSRRTVRRPTAAAADDAFTGGLLAGGGAGSGGGGAAYGGSSVAAVTDFQLAHDRAAAAAGQLASRRTAAPAAGAAAGAASLATGGGAEAGAGPGTAAAAAAPSRRKMPTKTIRDPGNFVRMQLAGSRPKHSFGFQGRSAAGGRQLQASLTRKRRLANGKLVRIPSKPPPQAGQGAELLEGFKQESRCFRCGKGGHWARDCPHANGKGSPEKGASKPQEEEPEVQSLADLVPGLSSYEPSAMSDDDLRAVLRTVWGHADFRGRQLEIIHAVLARKSMLAVLPTGAGKSLCYQLPALLLPGVTLVVSPLLALMADQLDHLPQHLGGACLSGGQTREEVDRALAGAASGRIKLLFVAPEKLLTPWLLTALQRLTLSLVAVDEAHCVSEWGHSFRPAYLRLGHILRNVLDPAPQVLALTATATRATAGEVANVLGLPPDAVLREQPLRANLRLKVLHMPGCTESGAARSAMLQLLRTELRDTSSVLVYVAMQYQADETAAYLQSTHGISASSYHAGRPMPERMRVQESFLSGATRVVVATVAFGMGVDHTGLGAVIHLNMPRSVEDYVQQVGRAGRDGREARCYVFVDDQDYTRYRSLCCSSAAEPAAVGAFLERVFAPTPYLEQQQQQQPVSGGSSDAVQAAAGSSFGVQQLSVAASELDLSEEAMETMMTYLEQHEHVIDHVAQTVATLGTTAAPGGGAGQEQQHQGLQGGAGDRGGGPLLSVLPCCAARIDVFFHRQQPTELAQRWPVVAALLASRPRVHKGSYKADMAALVRLGRMSSSQVLRQLAELAGCQQIHFEPAGRMRSISWQVLRRPHDVGRLAAWLHGRMEAQLAASVRRLDLIWALLAGAAAAGHTCAVQEAFLRPLVVQYFEGSGADPTAPMPPGLPPLPVALHSEVMAAEVEAFLISTRARAAGLSVPLSATAIARIFHALPSPAFPADAWRKATEWGRFKRIDFHFIRRVAQRILARRKQQQPAAPAPAAHGGGLGRADY